MKIAGFSFIKNALINDYPVIEAITSILPLCDEFVIAVGKSDDETLTLIKSIDSDKIKVIETTWDENLRAGGSVFAVETQKAFDGISKDVDWAFYIQADECIHEADHQIIKKEMKLALNDSNIEGLLLNYRHFYGNYDYLTESRKWYRREIRIVKRGLKVKSYKDAQGFRINDRKIRVKLIDAFVYHYGWVKPPRGLVEKGQNFNFFYDENVTKTDVPATASFDYGNATNLKIFQGTHPKVMLNRIKKSNWTFDISTKRKHTHSLRERFLQKIFEITGLRIGEYKNYIRVK